MMKSNMALKNRAQIILFSSFLCEGIAGREFIGGGEA